MWCSSGSIFEAFLQSLLNELWTICTYMFSLLDFHWEEMTKTVLPRFVGPLEAKLFSYVAVMSYPSSFHRQQRNVRHHELAENGLVNTPLGNFSPTEMSECGLRKQGH